MNGSVTQKPSVVQIIAVLAAGVIAGILAFGLMWCSIWKIYIDNSLLMSMSTILGTLGGALTTILIGRPSSQLQQPDQPIATEIKQPPNKPIPVAAVEPIIEGKP